ncbi:hypothetical protein FOG51_03960 [Hanseniaspora uvarum]|nr:hypothetical protein FOG51_03960 [Hanseniaspora uvarum]
MKFGKYLEARQLELPEYNGHFINYKQLKKLIKHLSISKIDNEGHESFTMSITPDQPVAKTTEPVFMVLQSNKAHFFFKLERELDRVNAYYLEKETYFKNMLDILQKKFSQYQKTGRLINKNSSSYKYLLESLKRFQREIDHLTQFIDLNRTGFGKVLKKWDKRSHSHTKDFYLNTVVSIQPVFTHSSDISLMTDLTTSLLLNLEEIREQADQQGVSSISKQNIENEAAYMTEDESPLNSRKQSLNYMLHNTPMLNAQTTIDKPGSLNIGTFELQNEIAGKKQNSVKTFVERSDVFFLNLELEIDGWKREIESICQLKDIEPRKNALRNFPQKIIQSVLSQKELIQANNIDTIIKNIMIRVVTKLCFLCVSSEKINDECLQVLFDSCNAMDEVKIDFLLIDNEDSYIFDKRNFFHEAAACKKHTRSFIFNTAIKLYNGNQNFLEYFTAVDISGRTPLHYASELNKFQIVIRLIDLIFSYPDVLMKILKMIDTSSKTPLMLAIEKENQTIVDHLIKNFPDINVHVDTGLPNSKQISLINLAARTVNYKIIKTVLTTLYEKNNIKQFADYQGYKPLHLAAENGAASDVLLLFLQYGCGPNDFDSVNNWTPIVYAIVNNQKATTESLIKDCGCDVTLGDSKKKSPLFYACWQGSIEMINILFDTYKAKNINTNPIVNDDLKTSTREIFGLLKPLNPNFNLGELENFSITDSDNIPDLQLPPPFIPLKKYGHNFLEKKCFLRLQFDSGLSSIILNTEQTEAVALTNLGRITLTSHSSDLISKNISLPVESNSRTSRNPFLRAHNSFNSSLTNDLAMINDYNNLNDKNKQRTSYAFKDILSVGDSVDEAIFQLNDLKGTQIDVELYSISGTKMVAKTVISYELLSQTMNSATNDGTLVLPLLDSRLKLMGQLIVNFQIIFPFNEKIGDIDVSKLETYWKSNTSLSNDMSTDESIVTSSLSGNYLSLLVTLLNDGTVVVAPSLSVDVLGAKLLLIDLNRNSLEKFIRKPLDDLTDLIQDFSSVAKYVSSNYILLDSLLKILPANIKIDVKICFPTMDEVENVPVKITSPHINIDNFVDDVLSSILYYVKTACDGSTKKIVFSSSNHMICSILNWKQPVFPVVFNMNGIISNENNEFEIESPNHLLNCAVNKDIFTPYGFNYQSVKEVVNFSKNNNLLGVVIPSQLLLLCGELADEIKGKGLLLIAGGVTQANNAQEYVKKNSAINGYKTDEYLVFKDDQDVSNSKNDWSFDMI